MREVAIIGAGLHPWGTFEEKSLMDMAIQVTNEALKDAGIGFSDLQEICVGGSNYVPVLGRGMTGNVLAEVLGSTGMDIITIHGGCAGSAMVYHTAFLEIASGRKDIVLALGADKNPRGMLGYTIPADPLDRGYLKSKTLGTGNPAYYALNCRRRMHEFGTTEVQLAKIAVKAHKNGALNPNARYRKVLTLEEVLASPLVADPLRLMEICSFSHGAAAVIMCSAEKARQFTSKPVWVASTAMASQQFAEPIIDTNGFSMAVKSTAPHHSCSGVAVWRAYEQAGIGPEDVSFAELADLSVWHELEAMENFGLCKPGQAEELMESGETEINGRIPINPSGGFQSFGEATAACGLFQMNELVRQLRQQAGQHQVRNPRVGICQVEGLGPNSGAAVLKI
jgi:acetyl-CoA acetyltransferase